MALLGGFVLRRRFVARLIRWASEGFSLVG